MALASMLNAKCTIRRNAPTVGASGAKVPNWTDAYTGVACSVQADTGYEALQAQRETGLAQFKVFFLPNTDITHKDKINTIVVQGDSAQWSGRTLDIISPALDHAGRRAYVMVNAQEDKGQVNP